MRSSTWKEEIEALRDAAPGDLIRLPRQAINEIGGGEFEHVRKALALNFPHAWFPDHETDNIIIIRLFDYAQYTPGAAIDSTPLEEKPSIMDITRSMC